MQRKGSEKMDGKKEIRDTVQYGKIKITNVPVTVVTTDGYEEKYYKGSVSLKLSAIGEYMEANNLTEYNFDDFKI